MNKIIAAAVSFISIVGAASCMTTFSPSLRGEFTNNKIAMSEVQFYNSETIELEREIKRKDVKVSKGTYVKEKEFLVETLVIDGNTPGGYVGEKEDAILISFDDKDDNKYLTFKQKGSKYVLETVNGKVLYNDVEYKVVDGDGAYLKIKADDSEEESEKEIVVKGRRVVKKKKVVDDTP